MTKHAPTPWHVSETDNDGDYGFGPNPSSGFTSYTICDEAGKVIADTLNSDIIVVNEEHGEDGKTAFDQTGKGNAAHIVKCVNAHDKLVEALKAVRHIVEADAKRLLATVGDDEETAGKMDGAVALIEQVDAALKLAEAE